METPKLMLSDFPDAVLIEPQKESGRDENGIPFYFPALYSHPDFEWYNELAGETQHILPFIGNVCVGAFQYRTPAYKKLKEMLLSL